MRFARLGATGSEIPRRPRRHRDVRPACRSPPTSTARSSPATDRARARPRSRPASLPALDRAAALRVGAPIARPGKIVCIGLNYRDHAEETGARSRPSRCVFMKDPSTVVGPLRRRAHPARIGEDRLGGRARRRDRHAPPATSSRTRRRSPCVAGYAISHDVSEREFQLERGGQWDKGKSCETFNPLGPWLVTADEVADPQALGLRLWVNGELRQDGTTANMIFGVATSSGTSASSWCCSPGDLINTGTPAGVALGHAGASRTCAPATSSSSRSTGSARRQRAGRWRRHERRTTSTDSSPSSPAARPGSGWPPPLDSPIAGRAVAVLDLKLDDAARRRCTATSPTSRDRASRRGRGRGGRRRRSAASTSSSTTRASAPIGTVADNDDDEWPRVLDINVVGMARVTAAALPWLRRVAAGRDRQHLLDRGAAADCRSARCTRRRRARCSRSPCAMAADHVREGIRVNCVCPGHRRDPVGRPAAVDRPTTRPPNAPPSRPGSPSAGWSPRRGRRTRSLPREPALRLDHRHRPRRRRRRHPRPRPAPPGLMRVAQSGNVSCQRCAGER